MLSRRNGIQHNRQVTAGGVLHAHRNTDTTGNHAVKLVLAGAGAYSSIAKQVGEIAENFRIENLLRTGEAGLLDDTDIHLADGDDAAEHILLALRTWLMKHTLVAGTDSTGLVGVETGNNVNLFLYLLLHLSQTMYIIKNCILVVTGAGADDQQETIITTAYDIGYFLVTLYFYLTGFRADRIVFLQLLGRGKNLDEFHLHTHIMHSLEKIFPIIS